MYQVNPRFCCSLGRLDIMARKANVISLREVVRFSSFFSCWLVQRIIDLISCIESSKKLIGSVNLTSQPIGREVEVCLQHLSHSSSELVSCRRLSYTTVDVGADAPLFCVLSLKQEGGKLDRKSMINATVDWVLKHIIKYSLILDATVEQGSHNVLIPLQAFN